MIRSLSTAVSGLRNHQNKLDVVGNNIANVNTVGYKYNAALFQNIFSQTLQGATPPQGGQGGINPMQVGLGMGMASSTAVHTQGALTSTGRESDLAIEGRGFFVVSDGAQNYYTRDGSFVRDSSGVLVNANGMTLMGWLPVPGEDGEDMIDTAQPLSQINIPLGEDTIAQTTTMMDFSGNLNSSLGRPINLSIDNASGIDNVTTNKLQTGDYNLITDKDTDAEDAGASIGQSFIQGENIWLADDAAIAADTAYNASIMVEVTGKDGNDITFTITSHEYNAETRGYTKNSLVITRDVTAVQNLFDGDDAERTIGNIVFDDATGSLNDDPEDYQIGDKIIIDVTAQAIADENDRVQVGFDSPDALGYDVTNEWVFNQDIDGNSVLDGRPTALRFFTLDSQGKDYDGFVSLRLDELDDSSIDAAGNPIPTTFSHLPANDSTYDYTAYAFDSLGNRHFLDIVFAKIDTNTWEYRISHDDENIELNGAVGTLVFNESGRLMPIASDIPGLSFDPDNGADEVEFTPDFSITTQLVMDSNVIARGQDGFAAGELVAFDVQKTGIVSGTYTNGMIKTLGQVAMASFINPEGLITLGANLYDASANSGDPRIGVAGDQGRGLIQARSLEMSNVDLANEFTEMITTNRAFQANSRVISTSDEVLQELVNLKR